MTLPIVLAALAVFFAAAERLSPQRRQPLIRRGFVVDVGYAVIHVGLRIAINGLIAVALVETGREILPAGMVGWVSHAPLWWQTVLLIVTLDFMFYVMHRLKHRWSWWWQLHETHHSSEELDWLASARFHPLEKILDRVIFLLPLTALGPSADAVLVWACADSFFGIFAHANVRWRLGPLKYIFVGPEMHRWHHAADAERRQCNFGNNLSVFDWVFGTAYVGATDPLRFGLADPNYPVANPVRQFFHAFRRSTTHSAPAAATMQNSGMSGTRKRPTAK